MHVDWKSREIREYYAGVLKGLNINASWESIVISPAGRSSNLTVTSVGVGTLDQVLDMANPGAGNMDLATIATYRGRSILHGDLKVVNYLSANSTNDTITNSLAIGPVDNLNQWLYKRRTVTSFDTDVNAPITVAPAVPTNSSPGFIDQFANVLVTFLRTRLTSAGAGSVARTEYLFHGLKIDY